MSRQGRPDPEQLIRELRLVLKLGTRPAKLKSVLAALSGLSQIASPSLPPDRTWDQAIAISNLIESAVRSLGDGPYGQAARMLTGTTDSTRGLTLPARRRAAAAELSIQVATLVRHREDEIVEDIAVAIYGYESREHPQSGLR